MKLNQNQADAFRWYADGKRLLAQFHDTNMKTEVGDARHLVDLMYSDCTFSLAPETIAPTMPKPIGAGTCEYDMLTLRFTTIADRDAALAAIRKEME